MEELTDDHQTDSWSKGSTCVRARNLSVSWSDDREKIVLSDISFEVDQVHIHKDYIVVYFSSVYLTPGLATFSPCHCWASWCREV